MGRGRWILAAIVVVIALALGVGLNVALGGSGSSTATSDPGTAPAVEGQVASGGHFSLAGQRDHWVLVNFFASWCTDCRQELGQMVDLQQQRPGGLVLVSVDGQDDSLADAEHLIRQAGGSWPLVSDPAALASYSVSALPQSFLVDPSGHVVDHVFGALHADQVAAKITNR